VSYSEAEVDAVAFGANGLVPAVIQDDADGAVLMLGYMNREALIRTLTTGRSWFWSRSRQEYWCKGETSGDRQFVRSVHYDCDADAVLVRVDQHGRGACHTGERSCFYRAFSGVVTLDAGSTDTGSTDTGSTDTGSPGTGSPNTGSTDPGT
jgi:phosphoribosyl-AMP cyclohydrolase